MRYFVYKDSQILGPFAPEELPQAGGLGPDTLVCEESLSGRRDGDWRSLGEFPELSGLPAAGGLAVLEGLEPGETGLIERLELDALGVEGAGDLPEDWVEKVFEDAEFRKRWGYLVPRPEDDPRELDSARARIRQLKVQLEVQQAELERLRGEAASASLAPPQPPSPLGAQFQSLQGQIESLRREVLEARPRAAGAPEAAGVQFLALQGQVERLRAELLEAHSRPGQESPGLEGLQEDLERLRTDLFEARARAGERAPSADPRVFALQMELERLRTELLDARARPAAPQPLEAQPPAAAIPAADIPFLSRRSAQPPEAAAPPAQEALPVLEPASPRPKGGLRIRGVKSFKVVERQASLDRPAFESTAGVVGVPAGAALPPLEPQAEPGLPEAKKLPPMVIEPPAQAPGPSLPEAAAPLAGPIAEALAQAPFPAEAPPAAAEPALQPPPEGSAFQPAPILEPPPSRPRFWSRSGWPRRSRRPFPFSERGRRLARSQRPGACLRRRWRFPGLRPSSRRRRP